MHWLRFKDGAANPVEFAGPFCLDPRIPRLLAGIDLDENGQLGDPGP
jgi:hypothetical protein